MSVFRATVVKEREVFWTDVESDVLTDESVDPNATDPPTSSTTPVVLVKILITSTNKFYI